VTRIVVTNAHLLLLYFVTDLAINPEPVGYLDLASLQRNSFSPSSADQLKVHPAKNMNGISANQIVVMTPFVAFAFRLDAGPAYL